MLQLTHVKDNLANKICMLYQSSLSKKKGKQQENEITTLKQEFHHILYEFKKAERVTSKR